MTPTTHEETRQSGAPEAARQEALELLLDMELPLSIRFGRARLPLRDVMKLDAGSAIELECAGEGQVEVLVNGKLVGRGTAVSVQGKYGVRISEMIGAAQQISQSTTEAREEHKSE